MKSLVLSLLTNLLVAGVVNYDLIGSDYNLIGTSYDLISDTSRKIDEVTVVRERQILVFTSEFCSECSRWEREQKVRMEKVGWTFGKEGHLYVVEDLSKAEEFGVKAFPSFAALHKGKAVKIVAGYQTAEQLNTLYRGIQ